MGGAVDFYGQGSRDSLDELLGDPGLLCMCVVEGQGKFGDAGMREVGGSSWIRSLQLTNTQVTDAGLMHLQGLTDLESLNLTGTQVTDAGLHHLKALVKLRTLQVNGTTVTRAGCAELRKALPQVAIERSFHRADAYRVKREYGKVIAEYTEAIRLNPGTAVLYVYRAIAYHDNGEFDKAIADFNETIRLDPDFAYAYASRGNAYFRKGEHDKATADHTEAVRLGSPAKEVSSTPEEAN